MWPSVALWLLTVTDTLITLGHWSLGSSMANADHDDPMHDLDVSLWIGKGGISEGIIAELDEQLEKKDIVKVRMLRSALATTDVEEIAHILSEKCDGRVIDTRGHTAVIAR